MKRPRMAIAMELTRFDLQNQAIQRRIAEALERIADALEAAQKGKDDDETHTSGR